MIATWTIFMGRKDCTCSCTNKVSWQGFGLVYNNLVSNKLLHAYSTGYNKRLFNVHYSFGCKL